MNGGLVGLGEEDERWREGEGDWVGIRGEFLKWKGMSFFLYGEIIYTYISHNFILFLSI